MTAETARGQFPDPGLFVSTMVRRVDESFHRVVASIGSALLHAGVDAEAVQRLMANPAARVAFLVGCCAEEVAGIHGRVAERHRERMFSYAVVEHLRREAAHPVEENRLAMDYHRLLSDFRSRPAHARLGTVEYMLDLCGLRSAKRSLAENRVAQLAIEITVTTDGVAGALEELMRPTQSLSDGAV